MDVVYRSNYVAAALHQDGQDYALTLRVPSGRDGLNQAIAAHVQPAGQAGALPLLQPKGTLFSHSYYLDMRDFWDKRDKLFPAAQLPPIENFDNQSTRFLFGHKFSQLLGYTGPHQRIVVTRQYESGYLTEPKLRLPGFAWVLELRDPDAFMRAVEPGLRTIGLLGSTQVKMRLVEEKQGDYKIVGYRFEEDDKNKQLNDAILFNFSPCFVRVGNQIAFCSTLEMGRSITVELDRELKAGGKELDAASVRSRFSWQGLGLYFDSIRQQLITQSILDEGNSPEEARKQIALFLELLDKLGYVEFMTLYERDRFRMDFRIIPVAGK
jgi:hypothetical protein